MGALLGSGIAALAGGVIGDVFSQQGTQETNAAQLAIAGMNNATMINLAKNAETYRFQDYARAGVNPMLVTGSPGLSVPSLQQPQLQNPNASFQNLGSQVTNAMQAAQQAAQIEQTKAQTRLIQAQTPGDVVALNDDGSPDYTRATGGTLGNLSAAQMAQSVKNAQATWDQIQASIKQTKQTTSLTEVQTDIAGMDQAQLKATLQALIQQQLAQTKITESEVPAAEAGAKIMQGNAGVWIKGIQTALGIAGQAASMAPSIGKAIGASQAPVFNQIRFPSPPAR